MIFAILSFFPPLISFLTPCEFLSYFFFRSSMFSLVLACWFALRLFSIFKFHASPEFGKPISKSLDVNTNERTGKNIGVLLVYRAHWLFSTACWRNRFRSLNFHSIGNLITAFLNDWMQIQTKRISPYLFSISNAFVFSTHFTRDLINLLFWKTAWKYNKRKRSIPYFMCLFSTGILIVSIHVLFMCTN